jgi:hypothetical protein
MNSKNSAVFAMLFCMGIALIISVLGIIFNQDSVSICAFIISVIAILFSIAIPIDDIRIKDTEKRLECFYKPIEQIIESPINIDNNFDKITAQLQKIRQYDHLAKDVTTKTLFKQLTETQMGVSTTSSTTENKKKMKTLLEYVQNDKLDYEKILDELYAPISLKSLKCEFMYWIHKILEIAGIVGISAVTAMILRRLS